MQGAARLFSSFQKIQNPNRKVWLLLLLLFYKWLVKTFAYYQLEVFFKWLTLQLWGQFFLKHEFLPFTYVW